MNKSLLELKHISIMRGSKQVLSDIHWNIDRKEHWLLMGPNGSGKTTLLEIASGYLWPMEGEVFLLGKKLGEVYLPDLRKKIGFVAPWILNRVQYHIPVEDVIASGLDASIGYMEGLTSSIRRKVDHQLRFFEALDLKGRLFGSLSSGEKLKVILSRSLMSEPHLLILDEPFAHLDLTTRYHCYDLLQKLSKKKGGPSMVLVTHYLEDICPFFTHALMLKDGKMVARGPKKDVITSSLIKKVFHISQRSFVCPN